MFTPEHTIFISQMLGMTDSPKTYILIFEEDIQEKVS